jgi:hypothetical protein
MPTPAWSLQSTLVLHRPNMEARPYVCLPTKDKTRERNTRSLKFRPYEHHNTAAASEVQRTTEAFSSGVKALFSHHSELPYSLSGHL